MQLIRLITLGLVMAFPLAVSADALDKARAYFQERKYNSSIIEAKNALQQDPSNVQARLLLGQAYLAVYKGAEAEKEFLRVRQLGGGPDQWVVGLAKALFYQGKAQDIIDTLPLNPDYDDATYAALAGWRAHAYLSMGKLDEAERALEGGAARKADEPDLLLTRARFLLAKDDQSGAEKLLQDLIRRSPELAEAHAMLGSIARSRGDKEPAERHYQKALEIEPTNLSAQVGLASLYIAEKRFDEAEKHLKAVLKLVPNHIYATYLAALVDMEEGRQEEAERKVDFVLENRPDYKPAIFAKGLLLLEAKKYEQADRYLALYLQSNPDNWLVAEWLAMAKLRIGEPEEVLTVLKKYGRKDRANYHALKGLAEMKLKRFDQASKSFQEALELAPNSRLLQRELAVARLNVGDLSEAERLFEQHNEMGELLFLARMRDREYAEAARIAQRLVAERADNPVYHNMLGLALLSQGKTKEAERAFQAALKVDPDYLTARFNLARVYDLAGRLDEAKALYEKINRHKPNPAAYIGLANIAMKRGEPSRAEELLQKAVSLDDGAKVYLARFYLRNRQPEKAVALLEQEQGHRALRLLVEGYVQEGELGEAIAVARRMGDAPEVQLILGRLYLAKKDIPAARSAFEKVLASRPDDLAAQYELARLALAEKDQKAYRKYLRLLKKRQGTVDLVAELEGDRALMEGRFSEAMKQYEKILLHGRSSGALWRKYDLAALRGKALSQASRIYARYLKAHPEDIAVRRRYAMLLQRLGDAEASIQQYLRILSQFDDDVVSLNNLAWLYVEEGDQKALELSERAFDKAPQNPGVVDTRAWALIRFGRPKEGVRLLKEWLPKLPDSTQRREFQYHLAYGLILDGREKEAELIIAELEKHGEEAWVKALRDLQSKR